MSALKIYNTLAREKQLFTPMVPGQVRMYVCGMTVYDYCHVGHARVLITFDLIQRWLRTLGYQLTYVRNITDIDDKIIRRSLENNETIGTLTQRFIDAMNEDARALGVEEPDFAPRATHYVPQMQSLIQQLQAKGLAYTADNGDVNYSVRDFPGYGKLSGKALDDLRAGERVDINSDKRDPLDFVLWKQAKAAEPEEAKWQSPWGAGRPGWHIECSAMACELLGEQFDIHGGGQDLQFPHHENEIAQSEGAFGKPLANYWIHNGFVRLDNEKMSKSLGNFFTIREVLKKYDPEVLRFFILRTHYRSPLNYSDAHLNDAKQALARLYTALNNPIADGAGYSQAEIAQLSQTDPLAGDFFEALNDDFNTPLAFRTLFQIAKELNTLADGLMVDEKTAGDSSRGEAQARFVHLARLLKGLAASIGLLQRAPQDYLQANDNNPQAPGEIDALIQERAAAKKARDFARADEIRNELLAKGIVLEDKPGGLTEWRTV